MSNVYARILMTAGVSGLLAPSLSCRQRAFEGGDSSVLEAFVPGQARGRKTVQHRSPGGVSESCIITKRFPGIKYDKDDAEDEEELCSLNFYKAPGSPEVGTATAICPKLSSTFPGVEVYELKGQSKSQYESELCREAENRPTKRLAKFKQSVSCCYTASILGYYHVSRILGGAVNVPTAVIRTMDVAQHRIIAERGVSWSSGTNHDLWAQVKGYDVNLTNKPNYFTPDHKQVFGALSVNPRGEEKYPGINRNSQNAVTAKQMFFDSPEVQRLRNEAGVGAMVSRSLEASAQIIQQMRDISDLILLDYVFQQQDRFGNIHYQDYYYYVGSNGRIEHKKIKRNDSGAIETAKPAPDAVVVKRMILKDNDCGSRSTSDRALTLDHLGGVRHMGSRTYKGIQYLAKRWKEGSARSFFENEVLLNTPDALGTEGIEGFGKRLVAAASLLKKQCDDGKLLLDLSIEDHLKNANLPELVKQKCGDELDPENDDVDVEPGHEPPVNSEPAVNPQPQPPEFRVMSCTVASSDGKANVRKAASGDAEIYMVLNNGASVAAVGQSGNWYSVEYRLNHMDHGVRHGRPAFIHSSLLSCR